MFRKLSASKYRQASTQRRTRSVVRGGNEGGDSKSPIAWFVEIVSLVTAIGTILSVLLFNSMLSNGSLQYIQFASLSDMLRDGLALTIVSLAPFVMVSPVALAIVLVASNMLIYRDSARGLREKSLLSVSVVMFIVPFLLMSQIDEILDVFSFHWRISAPLWTMVIASGLMFGLSAIASLYTIRNSVVDQRERSIILVKAFLESRSALFGLLCCFIISVIVMAGQLTSGELVTGTVSVVAENDTTSEVLLACRNVQKTVTSSTLWEAQLVWTGERAAVVRCTFRSERGRGVPYWDEDVIVLNPGRIEM